MKKFGILVEMLSIKFLWLPLVFSVPLAFLCPSKGVDFVLFGLGIPIGFALHEYLHIALLPQDSFTFRKNTFAVVEVSGEVSSEVLFLSSILPGLVLGSLGLVLLSFNGLIAIPFLIHFLTIPADIAGCGGIKFE